jgi:hypothetical protein
MSQILKTDNIIVRIHHDEFVDNPRNWDNQTKFVFYHRRYTLPNEINIDQQDYSTWDEMQDELKDLYKSVHPVYMYDHSGCAYSLSRFSDSFDSGQIGFIVSDLLFEESEAAATQELKVWEAYAEGDTFCFDIQIDEEPLEDRYCSGFYGYDHNDSGLIDCLKGELHICDVTPEQIDKLIAQII